MREEPGGGSPEISKGTWKSDLTKFNELDRRAREHPQDGRGSSAGISSREGQRGCHGSEKKRRETVGETEREPEREQDRARPGEMPPLLANESLALLVAQPSGQYGRHVQKGA